SRSTADWSAGPECLLPGECSGGPAAPAEMPGCSLPAADRVPARPAHHRTDHWPVPDTESYPAPRPVVPGWGYWLPARVIVPPGNAAHRVRGPAAVHRQSADCRPPD